jgi:hypothetical protein
LNGFTLWHSGEAKEQAFMWGPQPLVIADGQSVYVAAHRGSKPHSVRCVNAGAHQLLGHKTWELPIYDCGLFPRPTTVLISSMYRRNRGSSPLNPKWKRSMAEAIICSKSTHH